MEFKRKVSQGAGVGRRKKSPVYVCELIELYRGEFLLNGRMATARHYQSAMRALRLYLEGDDLLMDRLDNRLMREFEAYLLKKRCVPNTTSFYMRVLRAVRNRAILENRIHGGGNPFEGVFMGIEKTEKRAVSKRVIAMIANLDLSDYPELVGCCDYFMLSVYLRGIPFIDLAHLKKTDIKENTLAYIRRKTGKRLEVGLEEVMTDIINRYVSQTSDSSMLFPILKEGATRKDYESALRLQNKRLGLLSKLLDTPVKLTTYVSRHSWASIADEAGIPLGLISDSLGHSSLETTRIYLDLLNKIRLDNANKKVIAAIKGVLLKRCKVVS